MFTIKLEVTDSKGNTVLTLTSVDVKQEEVLIDGAADAVLVSETVARRVRGI